MLQKLIVEQNINIAISIKLELYQSYLKISISHELHSSQRYIAILVSPRRHDARLLDSEKHTFLKK